MKCAICKHGETRDGNVTIVLERKGVIVIFKNVPARVCEVCAEEYLDGETVARLIKQAEEAAEAGVQTVIRQFVAA